MLTKISDGPSAFQQFLRELGIKTALITGITGQDGSYLAEYLLNKGYQVIGITRRSSVDTTCRIKQILDNKYFKLIEGDISDSHNVMSWFREYYIDECYNLAAQSHVATSFKQPTLTWKVDAEGVLNILEGIRVYSPNTKFYQASTSEMFGSNVDNIKQEFDFKMGQNEDTVFNPQSPYAIAKVAAHQLVKLYRNSYHIYACSGILFNHESPRRGEQFVTRKITKWIGRKRKGLDVGQLCLGNIYAWRDWGHAKDYVKAMHLMLNNAMSTDYVVGTGQTNTVEDFLKEAFTYAGLGDYQQYVKIDKSLIRPSEVDFLCGLATKIKNELGWEPTINFQELVREMVDADAS